MTEGFSHHQVEVGTCILHARMCCLDGAKEVLGDIPPAVSDLRPEFGSEETPIFLGGNSFTDTHVSLYMNHDHLMLRGHTNPGK